MRNFKFRAWDKENNRMYDVEFIGEDVIKLKEGEWENIENFVLMQYTGFQDANGNEIYEGDIVQAKGDIGEIIWDDAFGCWIISSGEYFPNLTSHKASKCVIIGNIYENPELMENNITEAINGIIEWDKDGYPTEKSLNRLEKELNYSDFHKAIEIFREALKENYYSGYCGPDQIEINGETIDVWAYHTGGWSGNESIINVLKKSWVFDLLLIRYDRGGHYYFEQKFAGSDFPE